jgi:hypothetical protein
MSITRRPIPNWTAKECVYVAFAFVAAALAAFGFIHLCRLISRDIGSWGDLIGVAVFVFALFLMVRGVDAIQKERWKAEIEQRVRDDNVV